MTPGDSTICAVVLAAGLSSRMGTQKMLLPLGADTVVGQVVGRLLASMVNGIHVVVGHEGDRLAAALADRGVTIARNPDYAGGMLTSLRCGTQVAAERMQGRPGGSGRPTGHHGRGSQPPG